MKIGNFLILFLAFVGSSYAKKKNEGARQIQAVENEEVFVENIEHILEDEVEKEKAEEGNNEPKWKFSHRHHRIAKPETPHEAAKRHWHNISDDSRKHLTKNMHLYKAAKEKGDEEGAEKALRKLERLGNFAYEKGELSTHQLMPHLVNELRSLNIMPTLGGQNGFDSSFGDQSGFDSSFGDQSGFQHSSSGGIGGFGQQNVDPQQELKEHTGNLDPVEQHAHDVLEHGIGAETPEEARHHLEDNV